MTTEAPLADGPAPRRAPKRRLSKRAGRAVAWLTGMVSFMLPFGALAAQPKPPTAPTTPAPQPTQQVIIRTIVRHVYQQGAAPTKAAPKIKYVYAPAAAAPAPAPAGKTSGSHP